MMTSSKEMCSGLDILFKGSQPDQPGARAGDQGHGPGLRPHEMTRIGSGAGFTDHSWGGVSDFVCEPQVHVLATHS